MDSCLLRAYRPQPRAKHLGLEWLIASRTYAGPRLKESTEQVKLPKPQTGLDRRSEVPLEKKGLFPGDKVRVQWNSLPREGVAQSWPVWGGEERQ